MAIKAKKLGTKKGIKKSLSGGNNKFAQRVPEEGIVIRFLTEPEEWYSVELHFGDKTSFPCTGIEDGCLGCEEGMDTGKKWYANAYWPDEDRTVVFEMGKTVVEGVSRKYERNHTVMDRDFEITKEGTGMSTRYFVDAMDPQRIKGLDDMERIDMDQFFEDWLKRAMREEGGEEVVTATSRRATTKTSNRRRQIEEDDIEDDDDDDDDEDEVETPRRRPARKSSASKVPAKKAPVRRRRPRG